MNLLLLGADGRMGQALRKTRPHGIRIFGLGKEDPDPSQSKHFDLIMDFSSPEGFRRALRLAQKFRCPIFSGTTGLSKSDFAALEKSSKQILCCHTPNTSIHLLTLQSVLATWPHRGDADISIREVHHRNKMDSPSGTALFLAKPLGVKRGQIESLRLNEQAGTHEINFDFGLERLSFRHEALDRKLFAQGAWEMALRLKKLKKKKGFVAAVDLLKK